MHGADGGRPFDLEPESEPLGPELKSKLYFNFTVYEIRSN